MSYYIVTTVDTVPRYWMPGRVWLSLDHSVYPVKYKTFEGAKRGLRAAMRRRSGFYRGPDLRVTYPSKSNTYIINSLFFTNIGVIYDDKLIAATQVES